MYLLKISRFLQKFTNDLVADYLNHALSWPHQTQDARDAVREMVSSICYILDLF
jgi:hypothetical protein